jgi:hypothetical protein
MVYERAPEIFDNFYFIRYYAYLKKKGKIIIYTSDDIIKIRFLFFFLLWKKNETSIKYRPITRPQQNK